MESSDRPQFRLRPVATPSGESPKHVLMVGTDFDSPNIDRREFVRSLSALSAVLSLLSQSGCEQEDSPSSDTSGNTPPTPIEAVNDLAPDIQPEPPEEIPNYMRHFEGIPVYAHFGPISGLRLVPGQDSFVTASYDGLIKQWSTETGTVQNLICDRKLATRNLQLALADKSLRLESLLGSLNAPFVEDADSELRQAIRARVSAVVNELNEKRTTQILPWELDYLQQSVFDGLKEIFHTNVAAHDAGPGYFDYYRRQGLSNSQLWERGVASIELSPDGSMLLSGGVGDDCLRLWSLETSDLLATMSSEGMGAVSEIAFVRDGTLAVSRHRFKPHLSLWSVTQRRLLKRLEPPEGNQMGHVSAMLVTRDGRRVIAGYQGGLAGWSLPAGDLVAIHEEQTLQVTSLVRSPNENEFISGTYSGIRIWDAGSLTLKKTLQHYSWEEEIQKIDDKSRFYVPRLLVVSPDGRMLAAAAHTFHGEVRLFSLPDGEQIFPELAGVDDIFAMQFTPDGKRLVFTSGVVSSRFWCVSTESLQVEGVPLGPQGSKVIALGFLPDNETVMTAAEDGSLFAWNYKTNLFQGLYFDPLANWRADPNPKRLRLGAKARSYLQQRNGTNRISTVSLQMPVPPNATCTCNTVNGSGPEEPVLGGSSSTTWHAGPGPQSIYTSDRLCVCNSVCTCVPVGPIAN